MEAFTKFDAKDTFDRIMYSLSNGLTVVISTHYRATQIQQKHVDKSPVEWPLFRVKGGSLYMRTGKRYVCVDGCAFRAYK